MFRVIKQDFIVLLRFSRSLAGIVNASDRVKFMSLNNQQYMTQPTLINLYPNEYIQGLGYNPFAFNLDRYMRSCNTVTDLSNRKSFQQNRRLRLSCV